MLRSASLRFTISIFFLIHRIAGPTTTQSPTNHIWLKVMFHFWSQPFSCKCWNTELLKFLSQLTSVALWWSTGLSHKFLFHFWCQFLHTQISVPVPFPTGATLVSYSRFFLILELQQNSPRRWRTRSFSTLLAFTACLMSKHNGQRWTPREMEMEASRQRT